MFTIDDAVRRFLARHAASVTITLRYEPAGGG